MMRLRRYEQRSAEPETVTINLAGAITDIIRITHRQQMDALDAEHIWTAPLIDMRFSYKPENPLYLLLIRAMSCPTPSPSKHPRLRGAQKLGASG